MNSHLVIVFFVHLFHVHLVSRIPNLMLLLLFVVLQDFLEVFKRDFALAVGVCHLFEDVFILFLNLAELEFLKNFLERVKCQVVIAVDIEKVECFFDFIKFLNLCLLQQREQF